MSSAYNKFNSFVQNLTDKTQNFSADTFKVMLTNTAPVATNATYSAISSNEVANGNGYTTGGAATTITETNTSGTIKEVGTAITWTASGSVGPLRYAVLYYSTSCGLVGWWDYGSSVSLNSGDTFVWTPDATNGIFQLS